MRLGFWRIVCVLRCMITRQDGQDLIEYVLLIALLGVSVVATTKSLANVLSTELTYIANQLLADT